MKLKLKEKRSAKKLNYKDMAEKLNISKTFYWQIENDKRNLSYEMAVKISRILNTRPDTLFYEEYVERIKKAE